MPYAKVDIEVVQRFADATEKDRPGAIALYLACVFHSAHMLSDGRISAAVLGALADEIGLDLSAKKGRERDRTVRFLLDSGLLAAVRTGGYLIVGWDKYHSSRAEVTERRKLDAERKAKARRQLVLPDFPRNVHPDSQQDVRGGLTADSRAHARRRSAAEELQDQDLTPLATNGPIQLEPEPSPEEHELDQITAAAALAGTPPTPDQLEQVIAPLAGYDRASLTVIATAANGLTLPTVERLATLVSHRSNVRNPIGLLVKFLRIAQRERTLQARLAANEIPASSVEAEPPPPARDRPDPEQQIRTLVATIARHPDERVSEVLDTALDRLELPDDERIELGELAWDLVREQRESVVG